jgi:hypothetical protein
MLGFAGVGLRERQQEKADQRMAEFLRDQLHPGESIESVTFGQARARWWLGLEALFGVFVLMFATKYYYLVMTDQRLFMVRLHRGSGRPTDVVWAEPHANIVVQRFKRGVMWMLLYLRRVGDGQVIRFRTSRSAWGATERLTEAADVLKRVREGLPG